MNNNLLNFINEKMMKLDNEISIINAQLVIIDNGLYNKDVFKRLTQEEIYSLKYEFYKLENKCNMLRNEYKNLNKIRLSILGLL